MKRNPIILSLLVIFSIFYSCTETDVPTAGFKDSEKYTIYSYLVENEAEFSSFLQILKAAGLDKTLSAYNPGGKTGGVGYTLFAPDNKAVDEYIKASNGAYGSLQDLLNDKAFVDVLARYHVVNQEVPSNEFPFGTFNQPTLSNDFLNVNFDIQPDTTYYKINNQAKVIKANIETSNGYVQVIGSMLQPISLNSYGWLKKNEDYSIFTSALEATGIDLIINVDMKLEDQTLNPFTMLVEPDSIYKKSGIETFEDLANYISPERTDYTNTNNPLYLFVGYHLLVESNFLDDLAKANTNYNTFADIPLNINGLLLDIMINKGKETFVDEKQDSTDFVGMYYDQSNVNTQSGAIHFINQILRPQIASRAIVTFEFYDEPFLAEYRRLGGAFEIEKHEVMHNVTWSDDSKLTYVKSLDETEKAWGKDYLFIEGDFTITYRVPKIIQGKYNVYFQANAYSSANALVEILIDGNKVGGLVDMTKGGSSSSPYFNWPGFKVGSVDFKKYDHHDVQIKTLIPGRLMWDYIRFEPI